ncbi:MAG: endo-1,4-beta-xylanase, partial [Chitinophagaceae bacterium]|nr:endo-1,4-beta-xylanase [Rubrivivax sp.]
MNIRGWLRMAVLCLPVGLGSAGVAASEPALPEVSAALLQAAPVNLLPAEQARDFRFSDTISDPDRPGSFKVAGMVNSQPLFRAENFKITKSVFGISARWTTAQRVNKGDRVLVRMLMRALKARQESGDGEGFIYYRPDGAGERNIQQFGVGSEWTVVSFPFTALESAEAGKGGIHISFGNLEQTLEIAGLEALNFGQRVALADLPATRFSYAGRESGAAWRQAALARIDQLRISPLVVQVQDAQGRPVAGAKVQAEMLQSAFLWGSAVSAERLTERGADADRYRQAVKDLFDTTVIENGLKWPRWRQAPYRERALQSLDWLRAEGKRVKGHNLVWPAWKFSPADIAKDPERGSKIAGLVDAHIRDITAATRGKLIGWDVVNEPINETDYFQHMPREQVAQWFKLAQASDPKLQLTLNEYSMLNRASSPLMIADMLAFARMLKANGARVDVLGAQGHVGQTPRAPVSVLSDLDLLGSEGHQVQVTEFDMNTPDEALQADYTRDFLIALYSHKAVTGFIMWGFWESAHWKPAAAMFRSDWS